MVSFQTWAGYIKMLCKKGDACDVSNYRPISVLPIFCKKLLINKYTSTGVDFLCVEYHKIISPDLFGFLKVIGTIDTVSELIEGTT